MFRKAPYVALALLAPFLSSAATVHTIQGGFMNGNGADETAGLRNAVAAAGSGGTLLVDPPPSGSYLINSSGGGGACGGTNAAVAVTFPLTIQAANVVATPADFVSFGAAGGGPTFTTNSSGVAWLFCISSNNVTVTGLTLNNLDIIGQSNASNHILSGITITNNVLQNLTGAAAQTGAAGIDFYGVLTSSNVTHNSITNAWQGGYCGDNGSFNCFISPACQSTKAEGDCDHNGGAIGINGCINNSAITWNDINEVGGDGISLDVLGCYDVNTVNYAAGNSQVKYNRIARSQRFGIEFGGFTVPWSGYNLNNYQNVVQTNIDVSDNFVHKVPYGWWFIDGYSLVINGANGAKFNNNTFANDRPNCYGNYAIGNAYENAGNQIQMVGNVSTTIANNCGSGFDYGVAFALGNADAFSAAASGTNSLVGLDFHNNYICGRGTLAPNPPNQGVEGGPWSACNQGSCSDNNNGYPPIHAAGNALSQSCRNAGNNEASIITLSFTSPGNQIISSGSGTFSVSAQSNLSLIRVAFYLDSATTPFATQEISDLNSNFSVATPNWLYHATLSTSTLANGSHTIKAIALDANLGSQTATQAFTVSGGTGSNCVISTTSLPAGTVGVPYSQTLTQSGCGATGTWSITAGGLPSMFTLNASTGVISNGNPTVAGTSSFTAAYSLATTTASLSIVINAAQTSCTQGTTPNGQNGLSTDTFACNTLAPVWSFMDPVGGASATVSSGVVSIVVPAGSAHDGSTAGDNTAVLGQPLQSNADFTVTAKYNSTPSTPYSEEGIQVIVDHYNFLRCEVGEEGVGAPINGNFYYISGSSAGGTFQNIASGNFLSGTGPWWLRMARVGNSFTCAGSTDGTTFATFGAPLVKALSVVTVGPSVNTADAGSGSPGFTGLLASWTVVQPVGCGATATPNLVNGLYSDTFGSGCVGSWWAFVAGATPGSVSIDSAGVHLSVPASTNGNDAYGSGDQATLLKQTLTGNADFNVTAAFSTFPTTAYQGEGIQAIQDSNNFIRCEVNGYSRGVLNAVVYSVAGASGVTTATAQFAGTYPGTSIPTAGPLYVKMVRTGSNWVCSASGDNVTYAQLAAWNQTLPVTAVAVTADTGPAPGGTAPAWNEILTSFSVQTTQTCPGQPGCPTGTAFAGNPVTYGQVSLSSSFVPPGQQVSLTSSTPGTFTPVSSAFAGSFVQTDSTHASYQAPTSVRPQHVLAGCMVGPNDSIFNTRIDALPVNSNSATWTNNTTTHTIDGQPLAAASALPYIFSTAFVHNLIDNTVPATAQTFEYSTAYTGQSWQIPPTPNKREGGTYAFGEGATFVDHHLISLNYQTCQFYETYLDNMTVSYPSCPSGKVCTAASGWKYTSTGYPLPALAANGGGATDAPGFPLMALTLHASEVLAGKVNHALRWTTPTGYIYNGTFLWPAAGANGGDNTFSAPYGARRRLKASVDTTGIITVTINNPANVYTVSPTSVTFAGCTSAPTGTITMSGQNVSSINVTSYGSACTNPTATLVGGTCAGAACTTLTPVQFNGPALTILTAAKQYGDFVADATSGNSAWVVDADMNSDSSLVTAMRQVIQRGLKSTDFEYVDESALQVSQNSLEVPSAASSGSSAEITFTPTSGASITFPIALQGIAVGTPFLKATIWAGEPAYTIPYWVTGDVSNAGATWALANCSAGVGNCGTITSAGAFTPPTSITNGTSLTVTAVGTSVADATQSANVYFTLTPGGSVATAPVVSLSPTSLSFGSETVGVASAQQAITLTNTGNAVLNISSISIPTGSFAESTTCGATLNAGGSCAINVTFTPASTGNLTANLTITTNAAGSPAIVALSGAGATQTADESEFVGPFSSWSNVKTKYGAGGNGTTDDTAAIQTGINALESGAISVLYFPIGTYKVTSTLQMAGNRYLAMVGQDPTLTILKWAGASGGDILHINGSPYSRIQRLTFDGSSLAASGVNQGWDGTTTAGKSAGEGDGYIDLIFQDVQYGIRGGTAVACGSGTKSCDDADTEIIRSKFYRCSVACISIESFNSLNWQIFDSEFFNAAVGVTNTFGAGDFMVYTSVFHASTVADITMDQIGIFSIRGCTSIGSKKFLTAKSRTAGNQVTLQGNQVITPTDSEFIDFEDMGALTMIDNKFQASPGAVAPLVFHTSPSPGANDVSVGNTWNVASPITVAGTSPKSFAIDDVTNTSLSLAAPMLPPFAPNFGRSVVEVAAGASTATIQSAINTAATANNSTVVHLAPGVYSLTATLTVPGGKALHIWSDSRATTLTCGSGVTTGIQLQSPNRAVLGDFTILCSGQTGIQVLGADQLGARVLADELLGSGPSQTLYADSLASTFTYLRMPQAYEAAAGNSDVVVNGGGASGGHVLVVGGTSSNSNASALDMYHVQGGGKLVVEDRWYEGASPQVLNWSGNSGTATFNGVTLTPYLPPTTTGPSVILSNFVGTLAFVDCVTQKTWTIGQTAGSDILMLGLNAYTNPWLTITGSGGDVRLLETIQGVNAWVDAGDIGAPDPIYIRSMLAQLRAEVPIMGLPAVPAGATDVQLYRIGMISEATALRVSH